MSELDFRPREADVTEPAGDATIEQGAIPTNQQGTPRAEKSIFRRIADSRAAKPIAALLGLSIVGGAAGAAALRGSEGSVKAPDAIVGPAPQGYQAETPDQAATKAMLEQTTRDQKAEQAKAEKPQVSEEEKQERSRAILEAHFPDLVSFLDKGANPYYEEGVELITQRPYQGVSLVSETAPGLISNVDELNASLIKALAEHYFNVGMQGYDKSKFKWVEKDGRVQVDFKDSEERLQKGIRDTKKTIAVVVPPQMPWPFPSDEFTISDPMFNMHTIIQDDTLVLIGQFHSDQVGNSVDDLAHHPEGRPPKNGPGNGAS